MPTATRVPPTATSIPPTAPAYSVNLYSSPRTRYTHGAVNLRKGPGTSYELIGSVAVNTALQVVGKSGDWYLIRHKGREVFIAGWLTHSSQLVQPSGQQTTRSSSQPAVSQPSAAAQAPAQQAQQPAQPQSPAQPAFSCNCSKTCSAMSSCQEAYFQLNNCGCRRRDNDGDGVPCETICPGG
ncbi:MAG: SH3 domain-containing protein [Chloroflexi bacterium]|nr:SH3 domain-containing protein [Chloroflexota bacterium]